MAKRKIKYISKLEEWGLPAMDAVADKIKKQLDALFEKKKFSLSDCCLAIEISSFLRDGALRMAEVAANESIYIWLANLDDGKPFVFADFKFLDGDKSADPLTVSFSRPDAKYIQYVKIGEFNLANDLLTECEDPSHSLEDLQTIVKSLRILASKIEHLRKNEHGKSEKTND